VIHLNTLVFVQCVVSCVISIASLYSGTCAVHALLCRSYQRCCFDCLDSITIVKK